MASLSRATAVSYCYQEDSNSDGNRNKPSVTVASTIVDQQGIVKTVIHPTRFVHPYPMMFYPHPARLDQGLSQSIEKFRSDQCLIPVRSDQQRTKMHVEQELSILFFWSIPLRARFYQLCTRPTRQHDASPLFERCPVKMSIGIQNDHGDTIGLSQLQYYTRSEIAPGWSSIDRDETCDSLSYNPITNSHITPIGILKKKKVDDDRWDPKRTRSEKGSDSNVSWNDETEMRNRILNSVNLCVDHLSKLLNQTCPNAMASNNNHHQQSSSQLSDDRSIDDHRLILNNIDGIILHRGEHFGQALGDPMIPITNHDEHPIETLNPLLSQITCQRMRQCHIQTIEDLVRFFLRQGHPSFTHSMIDCFHVDRRIVEELNRILMNWSKQLT